MISRSIVLHFLLVFIVVSAAPLRRRCPGLSDVPPPDHAKFRLNSAALATGDFATGHLRIPLRFAVVSRKKGGNVVLAASDTDVAAQVDTLNSAYASMGVVFYLDSIGWYTNSLGDCRYNDKQLYERYAPKNTWDPTKVVNVIVCLDTGNYLGWVSELPWLRKETSRNTGVAVESGTLPGSDDPEFNKGYTLVHEMGHLLGLQHPFTGACSQPNDGVIDTPEQKLPNYECNTETWIAPLRDTCPDDLGADATENYMDYTPDGCMTGFTVGQRGQMWDLLRQYKPKSFENWFVPHTPAPNPSPSLKPTASTPSPTASTPSPTETPTRGPSPSPTEIPTFRQTAAPTHGPTANPTFGVGEELVCHPASSGGALKKGRRTLMDFVCP